MKKAKKLYLLLGVFAALCLLIFVVSRQEEQKENIQNREETVLNIKPEDVTKLSWETETGKLAFHKKDSWLYDEDKNFPVDEEKIEELLKLFEKLEASFVIEEVEDYGQYGLEKPIGTIQIQTKEKDYKVKLGDYSKMDSQRYVSVDDGNVYLVKEDLLEDFQLELKDMVKEDAIPDVRETKALEFQGEETYQVVYEEDSQKTYCKEDVYFMKDGSELLPLDTTNVKAYLEFVSNLNLGQYVTYHATEEEIKKYGLDQPDLTITMEYEVKNGEKEKVEAKEFVLHISQDPEEKQEKKSDSEDITAYARVGESHIIYKIAGADYEALMKASYNDLRHQEVFTADVKDVKSVDISLDGNIYTLNGKEEDEETVWYYNEKKVEGEAFEQALSGLQVSKFTDEKPKQQEEISLKLHLDNKTYPEVSVELYRYDGSNCLAVLDGKPLALVDRSHVVDLIEAVHAIVLNE